MKNNILTYGTFDLLHKGHINIIDKALKLAGDGVVVVGVSSDEWNQKKGKNSHENQEQRLKNIENLYKDKNVVLILEDHNKHMEQWLEDYDKFDIDFILMGGDHINFLNVLDNQVTPNGKNVSIVFTSRTPGISSTMLRDKLKNNTNNEKN